MMHDVYEAFPNGNQVIPFPSFRSRDLLRKDGAERGWSVPHRALGSLARHQRSLIWSATIGRVLNY